MYIISLIIIHQTHYEKSDWSRAFNQFTKACILDMINAISAAVSEVKPYRPDWPILPELIPVSVA